MNSLTELNAVGASVLEVDDTRPATVLFDKDTRYADLDTEVTYTSNIINFEPSINIEEIRNYASANARFRVEIITSGATPGTIDFGTLPTGITQSLSGSTYTLSGFKDYTQWDSVKNFTWTLPVDYTNEDLFYLKISIIYYDEDTNSEQTLSWFYYDNEFYYFSNLITKFSQTTTGNRLKIAQFIGTSRFTIDIDALKLGEVVVNASSSFNLSVDAIAANIVTAESSMTSTFNQTTDIVRLKIFSSSSTSRAITSIDIDRKAGLVASMLTRATISASLTAPPLEFVTNIISTGSKDWFDILTTNNIVIDWGDGNLQTTSSTLNYTTVSHNYASTGNYNIKIYNTTGNLSGIRLRRTSGGGITTLTNWGKGVLGEFTCSPSLPGSTDIPLTSVPTTLPSTITTLNFKGCSSFNDANVSNWNTANVTNMRSMFAYTAFNQPINNWNTANVTNMSSMFENTSGNSTFNQPLNNWNTGKVTDMSYMFSNADTFNQNISTWDTSKVTNMSNMFWFNNAFNTSVDNWNTSSVTNMQEMFGYSIYNQPLNSWNTINVTNMNAMFRGNSVFNQPLNNWNTGKVTDMSYMFSNADTFNQNIDSWNTANVTNMRDMFNSANAYNQPLNSWDVNKVQNFTNMFSNATTFNQPLGAWRIRQAATTPYTVFVSMFAYAESYDQDLSQWCTTYVRSIDRTSFDLGTSVNWTSAEKPQWGTCPRGY